MGQSARNATPRFQFGGANCVKEDETAIDMNLSKSLAFEDSRHRCHLMPLQLGEFKLSVSFSRPRSNRKWTAPATVGSFRNARGGIMNSHECIPSNYALAAFALYRKVQTSYFDDFDLKGNEFYALTAIPFTVNEMELEPHRHGLELFSLVSSYPFNFLRPMLLRATRRIKFQGKFSEISNTILEQNLDRDKLNVQGLKEVSNRIQQNLILLSDSVDYKLQEAVPDYILKLAQAGILVWVLNEDNLEDMYIGCQSSLKQQVLVARFIEFGIGKTTVAIGNGASDISIPSDADVRVGINDLEEVLAVMFSENEDCLPHSAENRETLGVGHGSDPWDPSGHSYATSTLPFIFFKIWDPGGSLLQQHCFAVHTITLRTR